MTYSSPLAGDERRSVPDFLPEKLAKIQIEKCQRVYGYAQTFEQTMHVGKKSSLIRTASRSGLRQASLACRPQKHPNF